MIAEKASDIIKETVHCFRPDFERKDSREIFDWSEEEHSEEYTKKSKEYHWKYEYNNGENHPWFPTEENKWINKGKSLTHKPFVSSVVKPWSHNEENYEDEYLDEPHPSSWTDEGKYYLSDYIKNPKELALLIQNEKSSLDNYWKNSKPFSWYKKQTDMLLDEFHKSDLNTWEKDDERTNSLWYNPRHIKFSKNIDKLIKLAELIPDENVRDYRWNKSYRKSPTSWYD